MSAADADHPADRSGTARILVPTGMLGGGFPASTIERGIALGADAIAVDGGSTDSGPYYLGAATAKTTEAAVQRDLRILVEAAHRAEIPLIVGSCGTSGSDAGVDWVAAIVADIVAELGIGPTIARIYSEQSITVLTERLARGDISPLAPAEPLSIERLARCTHVVGLLGHHPIVAALEAGAQIVLAGRSTDSALIAAPALMRGCAPGAAWHAGKVAECGGLCTTAPRLGGVLVEVDRSGFTIEPLATDSRCTPQSVAAHMLYENADPYLLLEPGGRLDAVLSLYTALDDRRVRVTGSEFVEMPLSMKLEGSGIAGYQTLSIVGIRDPETLAEIDRWTSELHATIVRRARDTLQLAPDAFDVELRCYGHNAVLGDLEPTTSAPTEVGVVLLVTAADQATATRVAKLANPGLLHFSLPEVEHMPSFAFLTSPAETERGACYEFLLHHVVRLVGPDDLVRTEITAGAPA